MKYVMIRTSIKSPSANKSCRKKHICLAEKGHSINSVTSLLEPTKFRFMPKNGSHKSLFYSNCDECRDSKGVTKKLTFSL